MKIIKYNKLIRDRIPEIIEKAGKEYTVKKLKDEEFILKLKEKMVEEANEVKEADSREITGELADVLEIVEAIENYYGISHEEVLNKKEAKAESNGRFEKRLLLTEVTEND